MEAQQSRPIRYKLVCEQNVFCYRDVRSYVRANYPKSLPFALKVLWHSKFIEWCTLCSAVCWCCLHLCCLRRWTFEVGVLAPEDFSVSNLPLRRLTIRRSCVCCSVCMRNALRFTDSKHCFADDEKIALHECFDGNSKSLSVECCLETKMRRDVKLLYDVMADTIGYIQVKMRAASLQLARTHTRFTHCARFARDEIINSLRSALREE